jgi:hypothetical protein
MASASAARAAHRAPAHLSRRTGVGGKGAAASDAAARIEEGVVVEGTAAVQTLLVAVPPRGVGVDAAMPIRWARECVAEKERVVVVVLVVFEVEEARRPRARAAIWMEK